MFVFCFGRVSWQLEFCGSVLGWYLVWIVLACLLMLGFCVCDLFLRVVYDYFVWVLLWWLDLRGLLVYCFLFEFVLVI